MRYRRMVLRPCFVVSPARLRQPPEPAAFSHPSAMKNHYAFWTKMLALLTLLVLARLVTYAQ
jgi:hypothetical protein